MIEIHLKEKFKSFDQDFTTSLDGNLIILSGINGSGKTQLMSIIYGFDRTNPSFIAYPTATSGGNNKIQREVKINNEVILTNEIEHKSFKDNITIPEITKATSQLFKSSAKQAYDLYQKNGKRFNYTLQPEYSNSILAAEHLLKKNYGDTFSNISEDQFINTLVEGLYEWKHNDTFTDVIGAIFYNHAMKIAHGQQEAGKIDGPAFDIASIGKAPWDELNELFEILNLEYRFKSDYETKYSELLETPILFQIDKDGNIIESEKRNLQSLSDGEKAIISLCFTSLQRIESQKKILLLDEFDSVLNPSLIERFYEILKIYFIDKGIIVILSTHSSATISLAPNFASYYEVFKKDQSLLRLYEVNRDEYSELEKVNKIFYDRISDQTERIKELENNIVKDQNVTIITEGKTDWKYILKALSYFHSKGEYDVIKEEYFFKFGSEEDKTNSVCGTDVISDMGESQLNSTLTSAINSRNANEDERKKIMIGIFDSDTDIKIKNRNEYGVYSFKIEPNNISTEFLFIEENIKSYVNGERLFIGEEFDERTTKHNSENLFLGVNSTKRAGKKEIIDIDVYNENSENKALSKERFAQAVFNGKIAISEESWENFRHIFDKVVSYLPEI